MSTLILGRGNPQKGLRSSRIDWQSRALLGALATEQLWNSFHNFSVAIRTPLWPRLHRHRGRRLAGRLRNQAVVLARRPERRALPDGRNRTTAPRPRRDPGPCRDPGPSVMIRVKVPGGCGRVGTGPPLGRLRGESLPWRLLVPHGLPACSCLWVRLWPNLRDRLPRPWA